MTTRYSGLLVMIFDVCLAMTSTPTTKNAINRWINTQSTQWISYISYMHYTWSQLVSVRIFFPRHAMASKRTTYTMYKQQTLKVQLSLRFIVKHCRWLCKLMQYINNKIAVYTLLKTAAKVISINPSNLALPSKRLVFDSHFAWSNTLRLFGVVSCSHSLFTVSSHVYTTAMSTLLIPDTHQIK